MVEVKFNYFRFLKSGKKGIFDIVPSDSKSEFHFLKFEPPRDSRLINSGVECVVMSFRNRKKILHSGIIPIEPNLFFGNNLNIQGKKDFILIYYDKFQIIHLFIFPNRNPKNKAKFCYEQMSYFIRNEILKIY